MVTKFFQKLVNFLKKWNTSRPILISNYSQSTLPRFHYLLDIEFRANCGLNGWICIALFCNCVLFRISSALLPFLSHSHFAAFEKRKATGNNYVL